MSIFKKLKSNIVRKVKMNRDIKYYLNCNCEIHPYSESIRIALIYGIVGVAWILFSDEILSTITDDLNTFKKLAIYKGWGYVIITMFLIYSLVLKRLLLFEKALMEIYKNFEELNYSNEELIALEEELRQQYNELETNRNVLNSLAYYDSLTELPNRLFFEEKVNNLISSQQIHNENFALIYMDIDNFKHINDTLGHDSGDLLLKYIANILKYQVKSPDIVARLGGDEFAIIFQNINDKVDVINKVQLLLKYLRRPWRLHKQEFFISYSIGISIYPWNGKNLAELLKNSDIAMYCVKKNMKDDYCFYSEEIEGENSRHIKMVNELRLAIDNEEFTLFYQPIVSLNSGRLIGAEALIRWTHPAKGIISPIEFIPLAEETGLIHDIEKWILRTALIQKKKWEESGYPEIKISINISGRRVTHNDFLDEIKRLIIETKVNCYQVQLEVTETSLMKDLNKSINVLKQIRDMGIKIALDDFGTGYSSLTYLQKLPIDTVKLDRDFIKSISNLELDNVIVQSVIKLTHDLKLQIVAEGIETEEQLLFLKLSKCDYGQGYLFSKPIPKEEFEKILICS